MLGNWEINVSTSGMPQKVASAMSALSETLIGASYEPIAYLGSQVVNGTNHAVLAQQTILTGKDTTNVVVLIFNEKPEGATLVSIERVVESGLPFGGTTVNVVMPLDNETQKIWDEAVGGFVGSKVEPFAFLGSQVSKGTDYIYAATVTPVVREPKTEVAIVTVNPMTKNVTFINLLENKQEASLGYAFTWLKGKAFGAPLGEWP